MKRYVAKLRKTEDPIQKGDWIADFFGNITKCIDIQGDNMYCSAFTNATGIGNWKKTKMFIFDRQTDISKDNTGNLIEDEDDDYRLIEKIGEISPFALNYVIHNEAIDESEIRYGLKLHPNIPESKIVETSETTYHRTENRTDVARFIMVKGPCGHFH